MSSPHKNHATLHAELSAAQSRIRVGAIYSHYKHPENHYQVTGLAFREATDDICVIYKALYDPELIFVRELKSWLETPEWHGQRVPRFALVK